MNRFLITAFVIATFSCSSDYEVEGSITQTISATDIQYLTIECYCQDGIQVTTTDDTIITAKIDAVLKSVGFHGDQTAPEEIGEKMLSFKTEIKGDTLRLVSKEWTYIHHSYLIEELELEIPERVIYSVDTIHWRDLKDRKVH